MERNEIISILSAIPRKESAQAQTLRDSARALISASSSSAANTLSTLLFDLLSRVIKPLFTTTKHPHLTSTGRKILVAPPPPSIAGRFLNSYDNDEDSIPWKTSFTVPLLEYILLSYPLLPFGPTDEMTRRTVIEAHFHLLVPAILNMIDDASPTPWKSAGCHCLAFLCDVLVSSQSEILRKSGLADVFVDALKTNFLLLPTLTPEEDSLEVLNEVYPAFLGVVDARFVRLVAIRQGKWMGEENFNSSSAWTAEEESTQYQTLLTLLFRHGVMASLSHLSSSSDSLSNTSSIPLTTCLLRQISPIFRRMEVHSVKHFQTLLPMLRIGLSDPFLLIAPEMVLATLDVLEVVVEVGKLRVRERWWGEALRGMVACWLNCVDEDGERGGKLERIQRKLKEVMRVLGVVVGGKEWKDVTRRLIEEEEDLRELFGE